MLRNKTTDAIFLRNFFENGVGFQPMSEEAFLWDYNIATNSWIPLRSEIDSYPISKHVKDNLFKLFTLSHEYAYLIIGSEQPLWSTTMRQRWEEMRRLAQMILQNYTPPVVDSFYTVDHLIKRCWPLLREIRG